MDDLYHCFRLRAVEEPGAQMIAIFCLYCEVFIIHDQILSRGQHLDSDTGRPQKGRPVILNL